VLGVSAWAERRRGDNLPTLLSAGEDGGEHCRKRRGSGTRGSRGAPTVYSLQPLLVRMSVAEDVRAFEAMLEHEGLVA
jgi:hypothetical protein